MVMEAEKFLRSATDKLETQESWWYSSILSLKA